MPRHAFARPPWPPLLAVTVLGQLFALLRPESSGLPLLCGSWGGFIANDPVEAARFILSSAGPVSLVVGWVTMLVVMMPPLLGWALMHIWRSSLPSRRPRATCLFLLTYILVWTAAGVPLTIATLGLRLWLDPGLMAGALVACAALAWSASPWQRASLNRGHRLMRVGVRGWKADRDALLFGAGHGGWCVLSCWPWMAAPMVAGTSHMALMGVATIAMFVERLAPPSRPRWRCPAILSLLTSFLLQPSRPNLRHG